MKKTEKKEINSYKILEQWKDVSNRTNRHISMFIFFITVILLYSIPLFYQAISEKPMKNITVEAGVLDETGTFHAMVLRNEKLVFATNPGTVDFFFPTGATVGKEQTVCSISNDSEQRTKIINNLVNEQERLAATFDYDVQTQKSVQLYFKDYVSTLPYQEFAYNYQIKRELENMIQSGSFRYHVQDMGNYEKILNNVELYRQQMETIGKSYRSEKSATVSYTMDGLEQINAKNFKPEYFNKALNHINRLDNPIVQTEDFLYRLVDNLSCTFAIKLDAVGFHYLEDYPGSFVEVFFPTKNLTIFLRLEKVEKAGNEYYAMMQSDRFLNRFLEERFLPIQLTYNQFNGLKIPNSSIDRKQIWKVPKTALEKDKKGDYTIQKLILSESQNSNSVSNHQDKTGVSVRVKVYGETDRDYYIFPVDNPNEINRNDLILNSKGNGLKEEYAVTQSEIMEGVYVLNKGYTDFKRVEILYQSENFAIVKKNSPYSIKIYDKIASEAKDVEEFTLIR